MPLSRLVGALSLVFLAAGCGATVALPGPNDTTGFPTPKDTVVLNNYSPAVSACESLFGNPNDIAKAFGLATSASGFTWKSAQGSADPPLTCATSSPPSMPTIFVDVMKTPVNCSGTETCGEPVAGVYADIWTYVSGTGAAGDPSNPEATKKWLTEVAKHVK
jgi:hypothetical protein